MANVIIHSGPSLKLVRLRQDAITSYQKIKVDPYLTKYADYKKDFIYMHGCQANYRDLKIKSYTVIRSQNCYFMTVL